jgi:hypothetical protein
MLVRPLASPTNRRCAATCRSAVPTVTLPPPVWFEAENTPWSCVRDAKPRLLLSTERCLDCARWEAKPAASERR